MKVVLAFIAALLLATVANGQPPNVVLVIADDLGWGEVIHGRVPTPTIDALADSGVTFSAAYSAAPVCFPSRSALLTGRYPQTFGVEFNPKAAGSQAIAHLPLDVLSLAEAMALSGYATGLVGKWHQGEAQAAWRPNARGFDEFFGFLGSQNVYLPGVSGSYTLKRDTTNVQESDYLTFAIAREAIDFVQRHEGVPFFLYVAFNAVHAPNQAPPEYLAEFSYEPTTKKQQKSAMTNALDDALATILAVLPTNTIVIFMGDNGGTESFQNFPLTGLKDSLKEGGVRVPCIVSWPGVIDGGQVITDPVSNIDLMPTILSVAGELPPPETDGVDLLPRMTGGINPPHSLLHWRSGERQAVRDTRWKARRDSTTTAWKLYDLLADPDESSNMAASQPAILDGLVAAWEMWDQGNVPALWQ